MQTNWLFKGMLYLSHYRFNSRKHIYFLRLELIINIPTLIFLSIYQFHQWTVRDDDALVCSIPHLSLLTRVEYGNIVLTFINLYFSTIYVTLNRNLNKNKFYYEFKIVLSALLILLRLRYMPGK